MCTVFGIVYDFKFCAVRICHFDINNWVDYGAKYVGILYLIIYLFHIKKTMYSVLRYLVPIKYIYSRLNILFAI